MTDLQNKLLDLMKWFHNLCEKENLVYFAQGGTALGAVRHKGFIPWDDDLDVGMPRNDYEKLRKITNEVNKNDTQYYIEFPGENKDFVYPYCKIYDKTTTLIENTRYKTKRGVYIDVFPIDGIGNTYDESVINFKRVDKKINFLCTKICALRKNRAVYKNVAILLSRCIPDFIVNHIKLIKGIEKESMRFSYESCEYVANLCGNWHEKEIIKKEWIGQPLLCDFEDTSIYILEDSHAYLTNLYGNYMQLPPLEKRYTHHDFLFFDLNRSYLID